MFCPSGSCPMPRAGPLVHISVEVIHIIHNLIHRPQLSDSTPITGFDYRASINLQGLMRRTLDRTDNPERLLEQVAVRTTDPRLPSLPSRSGHSPLLRDLRLCRSR